MDSILIDALIEEQYRQEDNIELIASENFVSKEILKLQGSVLTNKYAEGYPGKRYYGGCKYVDVFENKAIEYAKKLFNCEYVNVQPHSGSSANMAVYKALLQPNDTVLGMNLSHGGHLTHGYNLNFSGLEYNIISYSLNTGTELLDYIQIKELALKHKPKMIIAGASAYSRIINFQKFREIADECGAILMVDMAHIAGLVATNLHPSPMPYADVVTSTTHKTLRGPRGGLVLTNNPEIAKKIDRIIFPGIQGGPLMHVIAAKAQCFYEALKEDFITYQKQVIKNAQILANTLQKEGFKVISNGTDNHLLLVDVKNNVNITGLEAEQLLEQINITVNKNTIINETESPFKTSGIRLGTPAMTTRGLKEEDFKQIGIIISNCLKNKDNQQLLEQLKQQVLAITNKYPLYKEV